MLTQCTLLKQIFLPVFGGVAVMLRAVQKVIQRHYFFFLESSKSERSCISLKYFNIS